ncbi:MAG TPA: hypothetical protein VE544_13765 [Nitrososphaeraceae archaeon]|nr:hypothetical protein [Nitrososphaeraceae archaeon]
MTTKLMALMLIVFSLAGLAVSTGGALQTVFAQTLEDDDGDTEAELEEQEVENEDATNQDSSSDENVLDNDNDFGDDIAAVGQDNEADQDAPNVGIQDQDVTQEQDQTQDAVNTNVDFDIQVAQQVEQQPPPPTEPPTESECPPGFTFNPATNLCEGTQTAPPECPEGLTFNPDTDQCEGTVTRPPS